MLKQVQVIRQGCFGSTMSDGWLALSSPGLPREVFAHRMVHRTSHPRRVFGKPSAAARIVS